MNVCLRCFSYFKHWMAINMKWPQNHFSEMSDGNNECNGLIFTKPVIQYCIWIQFYIHRVQYWKTAHEVGLICIDHYYHHQIRNVVLRMDKECLIIDKIYASSFNKISNGLFRKSYIFSGALKKTPFRSVPVGMHGNLNAPKKNKLAPIVSVRKKRICILL